MKRMLVAGLLLSCLALGSAMAAAAVEEHETIGMSVSVGTDIAAPAIGVPDDVQIVATQTAQPNLMVQHRESATVEALSSQASAMHTRFAIRERMPIWPMAAMLVLCALAGLGLLSRGRPPSWRFC